MDRKYLYEYDISEAFSSLIEKVDSRLNKVGHLGYASNHECYGVLAEEFSEVLDALHSNDDVRFCEELIDVAVVCLTGFASVHSKKREEENGET